MNTLEQALREHELIVLRIIAEWSDLEATGLEKREAVRLLADTLGKYDMNMELEYLSPEEVRALKDLVQEGGKMSVAAFERQHGAVRRMGPGRIEREEPWLDPVSASEALWYRGFLYRSFDEEEEGEIIEYYYLPEELYRQFPQASSSSSDEPSEIIPLQPPPELKNIRSASDDAVDDMTALLALAQIGPVREALLTESWFLFLDPTPTRLSLLWTLAWELKLLRATDSGGRPTRRVIGWLNKSRAEQLTDLLDTWSRSGWNELCHTPNLACEGSGWQNEPILARTALLDALPRQPGWYQISDIIRSIKEKQPDFQRPDGSYDTWYVRDLDSGEYVTGFASWDLVEGRLLSYLIAGPMVWLGLTEIEATSNQDKRFRLSEMAHDWLANVPPTTEEVSVPIVVHDDATISVPFNANRYVRFQVARIADAEPVIPGQPFRYTITPTSLTRAREQGVDADRLVSFLEKSSDRSIPATTRRGIERWSKQGTEARLDTIVLLRVKDSKILDILRTNPRTQRYISESTGDLAAIVSFEDWPRLRQAAAQLGLLIDYSSQSLVD